MQFCQTAPTNVSEKTDPPDSPHGCLANALPQFVWKLMKKTCKYCNTEFETSDKNRIYCKVTCRTDEMHDKYYNDWLNGEYLTNNSQTIRKFVLRHLDYFCSCCGISDWQEKSITLDVEHIDGDSSNNLPENLTLLCPNCHSQTDTYKSKNSGSGRHFRRIRYAEGKSY